MSWIATEAVEEMYQKMLKSVEAETMPPNAWLWSMIDSCSNKEDIKLLFQILQKLRVFVSPIHIPHTCKMVHYFIVYFVYQVTVPL
jgi:hypothetical protein